MRVMTAGSNCGKVYRELLENVYLVSRYVLMVNKINCCIQSSAEIYQQKKPHFVAISFRFIAILELHLFTVIQSSDLCYVTFNVFSIVRM